MCSLSLTPMWTPPSWKLASIRTVNAGAAAVLFNFYGHEYLVENLTRQALHTIKCGKQPDCTCFQWFLVPPPGAKTRGIQKSSIIASSSINIWHWITREGQSNIRWANHLCLHESSIGSNYSASSTKHLEGGSQHIWFEISQYVSRTLHHTRFSPSE